MQQLTHACQFSIRDVLWVTIIIAILSLWYSSRVNLQTQYELAETRFRLWSVDIKVEWGATIEVHPLGLVIDRPSTPGGPRVREVILKRSPVR